ncbi:MAG: SDR family oxidoreductase [Anaerolineales bacterium]|jgi:NAD(P)-dependent dehydrogenase (short-subunit alcohol dehydrogenase family)|nr:SDR family oxidoreductase [Anaerolineales bacterium]
MSNLLKLFDLTDRVAIVTGGAGLLGSEFCRTLILAGARVVVADIDVDAAKALAISLSEVPPESNKSGKVEVKSSAIGVWTDVTDIDSVQYLVDTTLSQFGRLDILVNSAAVDPKFDPQHAEGQINAFEDYPLEAWDQALNVNLTGMFICCQAAVRPMLDQGQGVIINVCSIYGMVGPDQKIYQRDGEAPQYKPVYYSVTKAGVLGLTKYLATYYAGKNIRVNNLTPGGVYYEHDDEFVQAYAARTVLGRMAEKDEMNGALLFLASDASAYMTGANLVVDGGWTAW